MYLSVAPPIAFPLTLDYPNVYGLGDALPVAGLISAGLSIVNTAITLIMNSGCGVTCVETSDWANQAENLLKQNISAYFALPAPRSPNDQAAALANFDTIWAGLEARCGASGTGTAGIKCISDREAGACTWQQTSTSPLLGYPGEPQPGTCWNWFSGYRDPIANDPDVADLTAVSPTVASIGADAASALSAVSSSSTSTLLLLAVAAVVVILVVAS